MSKVVLGTSSSTVSPPFGSLVALSDTLVIIAVNESTDEIQIGGLTSFQKYDAKQESARLRHAVRDPSLFFFSR